MIMVDRILGNLNDAKWRPLHSDLKIDKLELQPFEAVKSRLRKRSTGGQELAISLPRDQQLRNDDILFHDPDTGRIIITRLPLKEVLVIELDSMAKLPAAEIMEASFALGHALGNQHWPAVIKGSTVYVPLSVDRRVMESVMKTHAFRHVQTYFAEGDTIADNFNSSETRLLFGGAGAVPHNHHQEHDHMKADR